MKVAMFTNTYTPHVGGVARSVSGLAKGLRGRGHAVLIIAPEFPDAPADEEGVIRIPALQRFGGSDFSLPLPLSRPLTEDLDAFAPDIIHSHHPFLLGDTALRFSALRDIPVVYTFHTRYDLYGHYVIQDSEVLKRLVQSLSAGYCNLCNAVIAPSESMASYLLEHEVFVPITVIPTGIDLHAFRSGSRERGRKSLGIGDDVFLAGHVGRLAPEKNPVFLATALGRFLQDISPAEAVVTGDGPSRQSMEEQFRKAGLANRVHFTGVLTGAELHDIYAAMDVFAFASLSETQGLVLVEAMAAGTPVAALDAPGVREVVRDHINGRLLTGDTTEDALARAISSVAHQSASTRQRMKDSAHETAELFSENRCIDRVLALYGGLCGGNAANRDPQKSMWESVRRSLSREIDIITNVARAVGDAVLIAPRDRQSTAQVR